MSKGQPQPARPSSLMEGLLSEAPTDIELMQYFDGELEEPRRSVVAAFVQADRAARNKVSGMRITSALVQGTVSSQSAADNIADLVMAKIAQPARPVSASPALPARPAANDNSRRIFGVVAALAVAAAAGLALWSRLDAGPGTQARNAPVPVVTTPSEPTSIKSAEPEVDGAVAAEADVEHGVEVAAVNFGAHMGSIFYVPSGSIEAKRTTTVVWLADDAGE